ncbi:hypothetical protein RCL_jg16403.t1 [Rhizophagus clarus]|uniref:Uncharacterized protein n=1 Tax=Rhizophagus clarus TaxID=94130 RepID=A0A8H3QZG3_9GLOM|nr:hypothetical protein RCL_jg16403.t1 [Rhizophagus clarus]
MNDQIVMVLFMTLAGVGIFTFRFAWINFTNSNSSDLNLIQCDSKTVLSESICIGWLHAHTIMIRSAGRMFIDGKF